MERAVDHGTAVEDNTDYESADDKIMNGKLVGNCRISWDYLGMYTNRNGRKAV